jgi:hypothetical protein
MSPKRRVLEAHARQKNNGASKVSHPSNYADKSANVKNLKCAK